MPKLTDVDGRACTELGTGRDCHYAAKTGAHCHRQGLLMSDNLQLPQQPNTTQHVFNFTALKNNRLSNFTSTN